MFTANKGYAINVGESPWQEWQSHGVDVLNAIIGATDTPHLRHALTSRGGQPASERIGPYVLVRHCRARVPRGVALCGGGVRCGTPGARQRLSDLAFIRKLSHDVRPHSLLQPSAGRCE